MNALEIDHLGIEFHSDQGVLRAVDDVSLAVPRGQTVALVGESGCGKSATALSILQLLPQRTGRIAHGSILFSSSQSPPVDLTRLGSSEIVAIRGGKIAMIFQESMTALNPIITIGRQVLETIELHRRLSRQEARQAASALLASVGLDASRCVNMYAHELSGGMCQRVMMAMALAGEPEVLVADEPTTALDVTVQAQILDLLRSLQTEKRLSVLLITHDFGVVAALADYVYVMYAGRIVEHGPAESLLANPLHPYTRGLLDCIPTINGHGNRRSWKMIPGEVPRGFQPPRGCPFHPRCSLAGERASVAPSEEVVSVHEAVTGKVLRRCLEPTVVDQYGKLALRELEPGRFVACSEAQAGA